jgi:hypothetical protein
MPACGSKTDGRPIRAEKLDPSIKAHCRLPGEFLKYENAEVIIGRMGDELQLCAKKHEVSADYADRLVDVINGPK